MVVVLMFGYETNILCSVKRSALEHKCICFGSICISFITCGQMAPQVC